VSLVRGRAAAANAFHFYGNECLSAAFTEDAKLFKQLLDDCSNLYFIWGGFIAALSLQINRSIIFDNWYFKRCVTKDVTKQSNFLLTNAIVDVHNSSCPCRNSGCHLLEETATTEHVMKCTNTNNP